MPELWGADYPARAPHGRFAALSLVRRRDAVGDAFFNYADRQAIFSVFPLLERDCTWMPVQLGLLGSSFAWVYGLWLRWSAIADRIRRKTAIICGLYSWSFICVATGLCPVSAACCSSGGGRFGRDRLLSCIDVAHQRLPRQFHPFSRDRDPPDQRYIGTIAGGCSQL